MNKMRGFEKGCVPIEKKIIVNQKEKKEILLKERIMLIREKFAHI